MSVLLERRQGDIGGAPIVLIHLLRTRLGGARFIYPLPRLPSLTAIWKIAADLSSTCRKDQEGSLQVSSRYTRAVAKLRDMVCSVLESISTLIRS